jgi:SAM-dependent methyltransferase
MSPLANSYLKPHQLNDMEPFYPLHVYVCSKCLLVQVPELVAPERIFSDYAYFSSYSDSWVNHARLYAEAVTDRFSLGAASHVVEIASNDGYLLQFFVSKGIPVTGVEPAANVAKEAIRKGIRTRIEFFSEQTARRMRVEGTAADLIVGNNVLAHTPRLNDFVSGMKVLLADQGVITMEFPHVARLVEESQFDTIYHEHFSYFSLCAVSKIFHAHGLRIFDVEEVPTHGGSLRIYACHDGDVARRPTQRLSAVEAREASGGFDRLERYLSFAGQVRAIKCGFLSFVIEAKRRNKTIVGYGAAAKGNTFLNYCGIGPEFIDYVVDRSPHKQGTFLPGMHIPVYSPEKVAQTRPDYLLILPWNIKEEVMSQMTVMREWGGQFVTAIPVLEIC